MSDQVHQGLGSGQFSLGDKSIGHLEHVGSGFESARDQDFGMFENDDKVNLTWGRNWLEDKVCPFLD